MISLLTLFQISLGVDRFDFRLQYGYHGRLIKSIELTDESWKWAAVCSSNKNPVSKAFASAICKGVGSQKANKIERLADTIKRKNISLNKFKYPLYVESGIECTDDNDLSTCKGRKPTGEDARGCENHENDVIISCQTPSGYNPNALWSAWGDYKSDCVRKWRVRHCFDNSTAASLNVVHCMMKNALHPTFQRPGSNPESMLQSHLQWIESQSSNCIECNSTYCDISEEAIPDDYMDLPDDFSIAFDSSSEIEFSEYEYTESNSSSSSASSGDDQKDILFDDEDALDEVESSGEELEWSGVGEEQSRGRSLSGTSSVQSTLPCKLLTILCLFLIKFAAHHCQ